MPTAKTVVGEKSMNVLTICFRNPETLARKYGTVTCQHGHSEPNLNDKWVCNCTKSLIDRLSAYKLSRK